MKIDCPSCGGQIEVGERILEGINVRCPQCNHKFIPEPSNSGDNSLDSTGWATSPPRAENSGNQAGAAQDQKCYLCGNTRSRELMVQFGEKWVCYLCKPDYLQMLQQGLSKPGGWHYGGFWMRVLAVFIDALAIGAFNMVMGFAVGFLLASGGHSVKARLVSGALGLLVGISYYTWFVGTYRATLGKMACGLMIVTSDGGRVSYLRAFGRYFAHILSSIILCAGYIMAAFDVEKRALHDRICDTRVVYK